MLEGAAPPPFIVETRHNKDSTNMAHKHLATGLDVAVTITSPPLSHHTSFEAGPENGDYESFGWWDLQGDGTHSDAVDAGADLEEDWSEFVEEDCSQAFDDVAF